MTVKCPYCRQQMAQPILPALPEVEKYIYHFVLLSGSQGAHRNEILSTLAGLNILITHGRLRQLIHYMNHSLRDQGVEQRISAVRHSGRYILHYQEQEDDGPTIKEITKQANLPADPPNQNPE